MAAPAVTRHVLPGVLLSLLLPLLAACDPYALQRREAALAAYVGDSETDIVRIFGVPTRTYEAGGHRFLAYDEGSVDIVPPLYPWRPWGWGWGGGFGWGYGGDFPAQVVQRVCETTFEVAGGRVIGFNLRGNACG